MIISNSDKKTILFLGKKSKRITTRFICNDSQYMLTFYDYVASNRQIAWHGQRGSKEDIQKSNIF